MNDDLQRLVDEDAIRRLTAIYSDAVTHLDARRAASIYAEDGSVVIVGNELRGRAQIEAGMRETFSAFALLQLVAHGGLIAVAGDTARARWSTLELTVRKGPISAPSSSAGTRICLFVCPKDGVSSAANSRWPAEPRSRWRRFRPFPTSSRAFRHKPTWPRFRAYR